MDIGTQTRVIIVEKERLPRPGRMQPDRAPEPATDREDETADDASG